MAKKVAAKTAKKVSGKEALIARLIAKASLDFKCCGHGHNGSKQN
ncbi:MAG: hypothetical protein ACXWQO_11410 [Bdellovibrionota bacterium]